MSSSIDRILDTIDAGLQSSTEASYGEIAHTREPNCVRCRGHVSTGDFCDACRAWMGGETDDDPADIDTTVRPQARNGVTAAQIADFADQIVLPMASWQASMLESMLSLRADQIVRWATITPTSSSESMFSRRRAGPSADYVVIDESHLWPAERFNVDDLDRLHQERDDSETLARRYWLNQWVPDTDEPAPATSGPDQ